MVLALLVNSVDLVTASKHALHRIQEAFVPLVRYVQTVLALPVRYYNVVVKFHAHPDRFVLVIFQQSFVIPDVLPTHNVQQGKDAWWALAQTFVYKTAPLIHSVLKEKDATLLPMNASRIDNVENIQLAAFVPENVALYAIQTM
jgi:hypothetical protein